MVSNSVFSAPAYQDHELVVFRSDVETGLKAIIAIHSTKLGPALGGCRMRAYPDDGAALADALQLSRAMTLKAAVAGLDWGGGKAVILGDPAVLKTPALLRSFGRFVDTLGGLYHTGEDVGTSVADLDVIAETTRFAHGTSAASGDPSVTTAAGVLCGMEAAVRRRLGRPSLHGLSVAVQGLGHVGLRLCALLAARGVRLIVADINPASVERAVQSFGANAVSAAEIHAAPTDVFAPCAMGGVLNAKSLPELQAPVIAGAANNQLADPAIANLLLAQGRLYVPDFVLNAGGLIKLAHEGPGYDPAQVARLVDRIGDTVDRIIVESLRTGLTPLAVAERMAETRLNAAHPVPTLTRRAS